jgi:hypothetical protein
MDDRPGLARSMDRAAQWAIHRLSARCRIAKAQKVCPQLPGVERMRRTGCHGRNACVTWVATGGHPGLERSRDCAAQWTPRGLREARTVQRNGLFGALRLTPVLGAAPSGVLRRCTASCTAARPMPGRSRVGNDLRDLSESPPRETTASLTSVRWQTDGACLGRYSGR